MNQNFFYGLLQLLLALLSNGKNAAHALLLAFGQWLPWHPAVFAGHMFARPQGVVVARDQDYRMGDS